jgi:hypothetical protein
VDSVLAPLRPGGEARVGTEVRLPAGYYQVMAHARVRSIDPQVQQSTPMQELASETLWLWIGDEGGYAAREQDQTRYPLRALAQPGPLRMPPAGARMRALLDSALADPQSHAVVTGTVTAANGRPAANVPVQVRAYVDQCPGRGAAEESARTDAAGRFRVRLRSYVPRAFAACVAVHADPPRGSGQGHAALRDVTVGFVPAASRPDSVRVQLRLPAGEGRG